tara:strand:- start:358 stop:630 length:273 start_codon:yes stop_codon:yes gene_type:complete
MYITQPIISLISPLYPSAYPLRGKDVRVGQRYQFITNGNKQFYAEFIRLANGPYGQVYHIKNISNNNSKPYLPNEYLYPVNAVTPFLIIK